MEWEGQAEAESDGEDYDWVSIFSASRNCSVYVVDIKRSVAVVGDCLDAPQL